MTERIIGSRRCQKGRVTAIKISDIPKDVDVVDFDVPLVDLCVDEDLSVMFCLFVDGEASISSAADTDGKLKDTCFLWLLWRPVNSFQRKHMDQNFHPIVRGLQVNKCI